MVLDPLCPGCVEVFRKKQTGCCGREVLAFMDLFVQETHHAFQSGLEVEAAIEVGYQAAAAERGLSHTMISQIVDFLCIGWIYRLELRRWFERKCAAGELVYIRTL